jgi:hypothetical protein
MSHILCWTIYNSYIEVTAAYPITVNNIKNQSKFCHFTKTGAARKTNLHNYIDYGVRVALYVSADLYGHHQGERKEF